MNSRFQSILLVMSVFAVAMSVAAPSAAEKGRTLYDYRFVPSGMADPFITTSFANSVGISMASDVEVPIIVIGTTPPDTLLNVTGSLVFVTASVEYQYAVHERATLRFHMHGGSRIGTSGSALLAQGVTAFTGARFGTTVELWRNDRFLLSGLADVTLANNLVVDLVKFADDVLAGNVETASVVATDTGVSGRGGLSSAWALNSWSGLVGMATLGYTDSDFVDGDLIWNLAGAYTLDFGQRGSAPIGLSGTLGLDHLKPVANSESYSYSFDLGVFYTGREDLNLGVELGWTRLPMANRDLVLNPFSFAVVFNYYF